MSKTGDPEAAIQFILSNAGKYAQAKANRVQIEQFLKSKKALLMNESGAKTVSEREAYAYAHEDYIALGKGLQVAVEQEETLKWKLTAAEMAVDVWRTIQANNRGLDRAAA